MFSGDAVFMPVKEALEQQKAHTIISAGSFPNLWISGSFKKWYFFPKFSSKTWF